MMPSLLCLLFFDAFSDHACVFLCVSMYLEAELLTHEEIPAQCGMATQEWMATQYDQASGEQTKHVRQPDGPQDSTSSPRISGTGSLRETTRLQGQATSPSLCSKVYAPLVKTCARRNTAHLYPYCAQRTSLTASDCPETEQHQLSPPKLRIPIPRCTSYNTISPSYTPLPWVTALALTPLALRNSLILVVKFHAVCTCTICGAQSVVYRWTARRASMGSQ